MKTRPYYYTFLQPMEATTSLLFTQLTIQHSIMSYHPPPTYSVRIMDVVPDVGFNNAVGVRGHSRSNKSNMSGSMA